MREDTIYARLAHFVIAFRVDEEAHVSAKISRAMADGTLIIIRVSFVTYDSRRVISLGPRRLLQMERGKVGVNLTGTVGGALRWRRHDACLRRLFERNAMDLTGA
jgi:hypothetical protein